MMGHDKRAACDTRPITHSGKGPITHSGKRPITHSGKGLGSRSGKRSARRAGRSGVAALEMALVAPFLITLMIGGLDFGAAVLCKAQITETLSGAAAYATLAGQNQITQATIVSNAKSLAGALTSPFLGAASVTAVINNNAASGSVCCPGSTWTCSTTQGFTCPDGSSAGTYITLSASYTFKPLFPTDTRLVGKTLAGTITAPLQ